MFAVHLISHSHLHDTPQGPKHLFSTMATPPMFTLRDQIAMRNQMLAGTTSATATTTARASANSRPAERGSPDEVRWHDFVDTSWAVFLFPISSLPVLYNIYINVPLSAYIYTIPSALES